LNSVFSQYEDGFSNQEFLSGMEGKKQIGMGFISYGQKRENKIRLLFIFIIIAEIFIE
jgi:hypothetical protein